MSKEDNKEEAPEQEQSIWRSLGGTLLYLLVIVLLTWVIVTFVGQRTKVDGHSMEPTLSDGDNLIVDKLSYRFRDPERYDIIVFPYQHAENTYYIKRIIGLPGETVQVIDGYMYINGKKLDEHYGAEVMEDPGIAAEPIKLGDDEYFVLGDNRNHSSDSRVASVGVLTRDMLIGRAWVRIYPFNKIGVISMSKESIKEIDSRLKMAEDTEREQLMKVYAPDDRAGVQKLLEKYRKQKEKLLAEKERLAKMRQYEEKYADHAFICGIDEVGRGPLAGPVVAGAVILPKECEILYINDSKKLSAAKRDELYDEIMDKAVAVGLGMASPARIDEINILQATYEAMRQAIGNLKVKPDLLLNDAVTIPEVVIPQVPIIKGDAKSVSIAAASIVAKVTRDRLMEEYDKVLPGYGFASNKGYGSAEHIKALQTLGPTLIHRRSFIGHFV